VRDLFNVCRRGCTRYAGMRSTLLCLHAACLFCIASDGQPPGCNPPPYYMVQLQARPPAECCGLSWLTWLVDRPQCVIRYRFVYSSVRGHGAQSAESSHEHCMSKPFVDTKRGHWQEQKGCDLTLDRPISTKTCLSFLESALFHVRFGKTFPLTSLVFKCPAFDRKNRRARGSQERSTCPPNMETDGI
jgi:hypothetical protein